jgi:hypothetical protein
MDNTQKKNQLMPLGQATDSILFFEIFKATKLWHRCHQIRQKQSRLRKTNYQKEH